MKTTNGFELLDVYDEIYRNTERFKRPVMNSRNRICPNCGKGVKILTEDYPGQMLDCDNCGSSLIISQ